MSKDIKIVWKKCFPNINKMLCRRNFTFQEKLNEFTFLFYSHEKNKHLILICFFSDKVGVDCLKKHLKQNFLMNFIFIEHVKTFLIMALILLRIWQKTA